MFDVAPAPRSAGGPVISPRRAPLDAEQRIPLFSHNLTILQRRGDCMPSESLAEFELLVMLAAVRLGPEAAYTVSIAEDIRQRTGRFVRRANVYTTLQRLEQKGLIRSALGEPRPERGGRPPRLVAVEPAGLDAVRATTGAIHAMIGGLGDVLGEAR
jgi:PadR family transcriptional regulator, regulatory protein PadR